MERVFTAAKLMLHCARHWPAYGRLPKMKGEEKMNIADSKARAAENHAQILKNYEDALRNAGPKLKELILDRAANDRAVDLFELQDLVKAAYPDGA